MFEDVNGPATRRLPPVSNGGLCGFLRSAERERALSELAAADRLSVFVGAGVAIEAGLPTWPELVEGMVTEAALSTTVFRNASGTLRPDRAEAVQCARWLVGALGVLGAAAGVKAWFSNDEYRSILHRTLYARVLSRAMRVEPGPTALELALLWHDVGPSRMRVITTNYDQLLEHALIACGVAETKVQSVTDLAGSDDDRFQVVHLHGILNHLGPEIEHGSTDVVLAEDEYFSGPESWDQARRELCEELLANSTAMFIGTSLTDPNILSYLHGSAEAETDRRHWAVMVGQGDQPRADASAAAVRAARLLAVARLKRLNVATLEADFFCQSAQFVADLRDRHRHGGGASEPGVRLARWEANASRMGLLPSDAIDFAREQEKLQSTLAAACKAIRACLDDTPALRDESENLALHLWVYDPSDDSLVFVARSDQQFFNPATLERHVIRMPIPRLVVEALCIGTVLEASGDALQSSRWGSMLVVPIILDGDLVLTDDEDVGRLPVGALVLASDRKGNAGLRRLRAERLQREELIAAMSRVGAAAVGARLRECR